MTLRTTHKLKTALLQKVDEQYPLVVEVAVRNLPRVREKVSGAVEFAYLDTWQNALTDKEALRRLIEDETDEGLSLWQLAPFAGIFTPQERWDILRRESGNHE
jgi:hypothetical protein